MSTMQVDIVTPDRKVFSEQAEMVIARTTEGEIGVLPNHSPLAAMLQISAVRIKQDGREVTAAISGGFMEVKPESVTILAELPNFRRKLTSNARKRPKSGPKKRLREKQENIDFHRAELALNRALNRLEVAKRK